MLGGKLYNISSKFYNLYINSHAIVFIDQRVLSYASKEHVVSYLDPIASIVKFYPRVTFISS